MTLAPVYAPLQAQHVRREFGTTVALDDVSLVINPGEFVSLIGPSGCGKSTLLALFAGLDKPTSGKVLVQGQPGVVFQEPGLFAWRTVLDNVAFGLQMRGVSKQQRREQAEAALRMVHLARFANAYPHELSGGMRQRAAIARALVLNPEVLLLDEPFAALDAQTRALLQAELLSIWEKTRKTIVFVTHGLDEALTMSDRIVLMSARPGRILGDFRVDAPRPRDPSADPTLATLRRHLSEQLAREVALVAQAEHDPDWQTRQPATTPDTNVGADI